MVYFSLPSEYGTRSRSVVAQHACLSRRRSRVRIPSVPLSCFQPRRQQAPCMDRGFDRSIISFPLPCLSPDASRLCPQIADSTASVPLTSYPQPNTLSSVGWVLFVEKLYVSGEKYFVGLKLRTAIVLTYLFSVHHSSSFSEDHPPVFLPFSRMAKIALTNTQRYGAEPGAFVMFAV
jgi:hypothetical protein